MHTKNLLGLILLATIVTPLLSSSTNILPQAHGFSPATWVQNKQFKALTQMPSTIVFYSNVKPIDCSHFATTQNRCSGSDTTYGTFSYSVPKSYGVVDSCDYPCESQDVFVGYPPTFSYKGTVYYFNSAMQDQCAPDFGCSTQTTWTSLGPVAVPYSGTPVGTPITIDTQIFYKNMSNSEVVEVEFTYNLDDGYGFG
ncbi:MAG TPA: hypothetical protein VJ792_01350 [Candidatus Nitrosotalea sp.]|nr:hypothetical protein [Candidatus Nitrosotalea sp.]